jgi:6-phosphogluconolactonase
MDARVADRVHLYRDLSAASAALAAHVEERAWTAVRSRGRFTWVLSGGSTPRTLYRILARRPARSFPWRRTEVFFADERCVPPGDPQSNYGNAQAELLDQVPIPRAQVHRLEGEVRPMARAAASYARMLGVPPAGPPGRRRPRFDLVLLGLGEDGHTASLFPNSAALRARRRAVVSVARPGQPPFVPRLTLTLPTLGDSREVCFLVAGTSKARAVARVLRSSLGGTAAVPASLVRSYGPLEWYLDRAAAATLAKAMAPPEPPLGRADAALGRARRGRPVRGARSSRPARSAAAAVRDRSPEARSRAGV